MNEELLRIIELFDEDEVTTADKIDRPQKALEREMYDDFMKRNKLAGGGMLVEPGFGGTRQGYRAPRKTDESYRKVVKDFTATSGPGTGRVLDDPAAIDIVKAELNKIKKQRNNKNLFEWSEKSDWYKNLQKRLNPNTKKGLNREFTNKLINQVVDEFFPGAYHGKDAIKNFRNDMVVKSFIQHLKSVGEFDGQEKFDKVLDQFTYRKDGKRKDKMHLYEDINRSWNAWRKGEFEVDGIDRAELRKELKARGISYGQIDKWKASAAQARGTQKIAEIKFLDNQNTKFPNRSLEQVEKLFKQKFPNGNFALRVNNLTEIKRNGVYISGANSEKGITGIDKGDRAGWLKQAYGKQFAGNYSKIINAADQLADAGETAKAQRLYNAADKFFGPTGIVRKSAVGEAEHALARSFDFLNPDRQLAINSIVSGDLNQFKKNLFDIPVKRHFDEYNNPNTTKARRVELKNLIENRKKVMNALTGGQKSGIVAGDIVSFRYGPTKITATSSVKPIDTLFKEGKFNIDDYIERGNKYTEAFQSTGKEAGILTAEGNILKNFKTPINENKVKKLIATLGGGKCGTKGLLNQGGRVGLQDGTLNVDVCYDRATKRINSGFKNATPAEARNYTKLLNAVKGSAVIGKNLLKFGIVPEALYVGADSLVRMGFGDTFKEAGLRASDFFIPGDQMQEADKLKVQRTLGDAAATNVGRVFDYKNQIANIDNLKQQKQNFENLSGGGAFDYVGDLSQDIKNIDTRLNQAKNDLQNKFMVSEAETVAADQALEEAYDISKAKSPLARLKRFAQNIEAVQDDPFLSDIATPQKTQMDLNLNMFPTAIPTQTNFMKMTDTDIINKRRNLIDSGVTGLPSSRDLMLIRDAEIADREKKIDQFRTMPLMDAANQFGREQVFGTQGTFFGQPIIETQPRVRNTSQDIDPFQAAGGGIAKMAGVDSGPPPESGPLSQGLPGLLKRGIKT